MNERDNDERKLMLRVIGLSEKYVRAQAAGSEQQKHGLHMLEIYRSAYAQRWGREATAGEVTAAMRDVEQTAHAANPYGCNRYGHRCPQKGTTREPQTKGTPHRVHRVDQTQPMHKQVNDLADALERAARDGARLEAVIYRPEFGELTLDCGNPGRKNDSQDSRGHGVQHALEERHGISAWAIAETLLTGIVTQSESHSSRLLVETKKYRVVLEREIQKGSGRINKIRAKLHTAMKNP